MQPALVHFTATGGRPIINTTNSTDIHLLTHPQQHQYQQLTLAYLASRVPSYREISLCLLSRPRFSSRTRISSLAAVDSAGETPPRQSCFENPSPIGFGEAETNNHECDFAHFVVHCEKGRKPGGLIRPSLAAPPTAHIRISRRIRFPSRRHRTPRARGFAARLITVDARAT